jgi:hypothetical protein
MTETALCTTPTGQGRASRPLQGLTGGGKAVPSTSRDLKGARALE